MKIELMNGNKEQEIKDRTKLIAVAGQISHSNKELFDLYNDREDYEDNLKVIGRIVGSGHTSITEHDRLTFFITGVTPIIEQILIGQRLASFTIKSRRYVDFSNSGFYIPNFKNINNYNEVSNKYKEHMNYLFDTYSKMVELGVPKEDARFILPYCFYSQITMSLNTRSLIKLIEYCTMGHMSRIDEVKEFGLKMLEIAEEKIPYYKKNYEIIKKQISENTINYDELDFLEKYSNKYEILDGPKLISCHADYDSNDRIDKTIIVSFIMCRYQVGFSKANNIYDKLTDFEKEQIMSTICNSNENRELEHVSFKFEFPITLAVLTHWTRQRMHSLLIPDFLPMYNLNNYIIPKSIKNECLELYLGAVNKNVEIYNELKQMGVQEKDLVYFNLSGTKINVSTNINGRELMWISRLRCCNRAQWEIRELSNSMIEMVRDEANLYGSYLGAACGITGKCPEGKHSCGNPYVYRRK